MAKRRNVVGKIVSIMVLIIISVIVFNRGTIINSLKSFIGFGELQLFEVKTVTFDYDVESGIIPNIFLLDEKIVSVVDSKITMFADDGEAKWQEVNDFESVLVDGNKNFFVVVDYSKGNIYTYDYRGNVNASLFGLGEVSDVLVSEEGYIIIQQNISNSINVYDPKLNQLSALKVNQGEITKLKINEENQYVYVGTVDVSDTKINSYLYKYDLNGNLIGSIQMIDEILFDFYFENGNVIKVSDQEIATYSIDMEPIDKFNSVGVVDLTAYKDNVVVTQVFDEQSKINDVTPDYDSIAFDLLKNEVVYNNILSKGYNEMFYYESHLICYNNNNVTLFDDQGEIVREFDLPRDVKKIKILSDSFFVMMGTDYFTIYELKY